MGFPFFPPARTIAETTRHHYDKSKITTLSSLERIWLRTGMDIRRIGTGAHYDDSIYVLLKEVIDNAVEEYIMDSGREARIDHEGPRVWVRDFG